MAASGVIADVLPATAYSLKKPYAPVRRMIELGVPVALATDCNPGSSFTESVPFVFGLGVLAMDMTVKSLDGHHANAPGPWNAPPVAVGGGYSRFSPSRRTMPPSGLHAASPFVMSL
jgi:hypothetical protein